MIDSNEAFARVVQTVGPLGSETIPLSEAAGRVIASDLTARCDAPRSAVSAMDGFAVLEAATSPGQSLDVIGESRAGAGFSGKVEAGQAVRIFTGAPLPAGTDCVIVQEHAERDGALVRFTEGYGPARHVREAASDFAAGDVLLPAGTRLGPRAMVAAAAADRAEVEVSRRPKVAIIGTGDELAEPGRAHLSAGTIPESVSHGIAAMVAEMGGEIVARLSGDDDLDALIELAGQALTAADLVITTGGASVGERDFAKPMFAAHGLETEFEKVAIKPGKPVWFGTAGGKLVIGLPGNPTSAMVTATLFLRPILGLMQGMAADDVLRWRKLPLAAPLGPTGDRETFVRARWEDAGLVPVANQQSGAQAALVNSDWLIRCPAGQAAQQEGAIVSATRF